MSASKPRSTTSTKRRTTGFGFDPAESPYHFALIRRATEVLIVERVGDDGAAPTPNPSPDPEGGEPVLPPSPQDWGEGGPGGIGGQPKARLSIYHWERIADTAAAEFNDRLLATGGRSGRWLKEETPLAPHFGKELTLLAWAIEEADPTLIPTMLANWRGLAPEERWWFYTTINATTTHPDYGKDRGWRKAIKIAFADNPVHVPPSALLVGPMPIAGKKQKPGRTAKPKPATPETQGRLRLFDAEDPSA